MSAPWDLLSRYRALPHGEGWAVFSEAGKRVSEPIGEHRQAQAEADRLNRVEQYAMAGLKKR